MSHAPNVIEFRDPRRIDHRMRCVKCGDFVLVSVLDGAFLPREAVYRCCNCHETPAATEARLALLEPPPTLDAA